MRNLTLVATAFAIIAVHVIPAGNAQAAQDNSRTSIILHVVDATSVPCSPLPFDCETVEPTVNAAGMATPAVCVLLRYYEAAAGLQAAFSVPDTWTFTASAWDCQPGQMSERTPSPPFGPTAGTITTRFDALTGGHLAMIGRMFFGSAGDDCIFIAESDYPDGTHVVSPSGTPTPVAENGRGIVCVGFGGYDSCSPSPVEESTWGGIKGQYR